MSEGKGYKIKENVIISEEVISVITGLAATEVEGVKALGNGLTAESISKAGSGKLSKAIRIASDGRDGLVVRISVILRYGMEIPEVCEQIQERIKTMVESMTGLSVSDVDIRISAVEME